MKYFVTMSNCRIRPVLFFLIFLPFQFFGQTAHVSPLSYYGMGTISSKFLSADIGFGGANTAFSAPDLINIANPATYHFLYTQQIDVGFQVLNSNYTLPNGDFSSSGSQIRSFNYGFSMGNKLGFVLGLKPFSSANYELTETNVINNTTQIANYYFGQGGFNNAIVGMSYRLLKDSLNIISVGANFNYLFGFQNRFQYSIISESGSANFNGKYQNQVGISDVYFDFGLHYMRKINQKLSLGAGFTYTPQQNLNSNQLNYFGTFTGIPGNEIPKDTGYFFTDTSLSTLPQSIGFGLTAEVGLGLVFVADYKTTAFSNANFLGNNLNILDRNELALGIQYIPDIEEVTKIFKVTKYRVGARLVNTGLQYNNNPVNQFGITFGLGLPLLKSQSFTSVNIGAEIGNRNNGNAGTFNEQYSNFFIGVSIAPHKFDRWFVRRKID